MKKRRKEFSKIIASAGLFLWIFVTVYALVMMAIMLDLSPLPYVLASVNAVIASICGFYFWKAKAESIIKLREKHGQAADNIENIETKETHDDEPWVG